MAITVDGELPPGVTSKDLILAVIAKIGTGGGQGYVLEYRGEAIRKLSMEARMTICNMSIEAGARAGMIAPDETTYEFIKGRPHAPSGAEWDEAVAAWELLKTDEGAEFDNEVHIDASALTPFVTWGTNPGQGAPLGDRVPDPELIVDESERQGSREGAHLHGSSTPVCRFGMFLSTPCSSVRAPTDASKTCAQWRRCSRVAMWQRAFGCSSFPARCGCGLKPKAKVSVKSSQRQGLNGARPVARCAWE